MGCPLDASRGLPQRTGAAGRPSPTQARCDRVLCRYCQATHGYLDTFRIPPNGCLQIRILQ
eukprot:4502652-Prymnesium_polylepis.1